MEAGAISLISPSIHRLTAGAFRASGTTEMIWFALTELSQLRAIFGNFAVIFVVKSRASIAELWKNGRVETKCLPFAPGLLAICRQHVSAQQQSQKRRQGSSLLQHRRKPSQRFGQDGAANRSLSRRDQRSATSGMAQDVVGV